MVFMQITLSELNGYISPGTAISVLAKSGSSISGIPDEWLPDGEYSRRYGGSLRVGTQFYRMEAGYRILGERYAVQMLSFYSPAAYSPSIPQNFDITVQSGNLQLSWSPVETNTQGGSTVSDHDRSGPVYGVPRPADVGL